MTLDRKIVVASIALFCSALILGAVIYNAASIQNASPYPQDAVTPQLPESPATSSTPTESSLLNSKTLTVPDDYPTITEAIGNASTGDTVFVKKGTYEGIINQTLLINKTISLLGENASNTKISLHPPLVPYTIFTQTFLGYDNSIRIEASGVKLAGFTITSDGGGISATGNATEISDNIMSMGATAVGDRTKIIGNIMASVNLRGCNQTIAQNTISGGIGEFLVYYAAKTAL